MTKFNYQYKDGSEVKEGDYIKFADDNWNPVGRAYKVYSWSNENSEGLGVDATNPQWIEDGRAFECEYGIYPFEISDRFVKITEEEAMKTIATCDKRYKIELRMELDFNSMEKFYGSYEWKLISNLIDSTKVLSYGTTLEKD